MPKFRKRAIEVEAEQWVPHRDVRGVCCYEGCDSNRPHVHTIHAGQIVELEPGDWIIPDGDRGHFYPVKPDIFAATYERADSIPSETVAILPAAIGALQLLNELMAYTGERPLLYAPSEDDRRRVKAFESALDALGVLR